MAKIWTIVFFMLAAFPAIALAAPDPNEVEAIKQAAPVHLIGTVIEDEMLEQIDDSNFPYQERKMVLQITSIVKGLEEADASSSVEVHYTYIPSWLEMEGGARMDIAKSDEIEIWLKKEAGVWEPALSGNTVVHLYKNEKRPQHMLPPATTMPNFIKSKLSAMPLGMIVAVLLFFSLILIAGISKRFSAR